MDEPFLPGHGHVTAVAQAVTRRRILFVQCGALFSPYRRALLQAMPGLKMSVTEFLSARADLPASTTVTIVDVDVFVGDHPTHTLGELREAVFSAVDTGGKICLLSRAPKIAFKDVVGSSLLEDAATHYLPLLTDSDFPGETLETRPDGWSLPALASRDIETLQEAYALSLSELGTEVLCGLDHALYESHPRSTEGLRFLGRRVTEALRGAGIVALDGASVPQLAVENRLTEFKEALATVMSGMTSPPADLAPITTGLWYIERSIRSALREAAVKLAGGRWRGEIVSGPLGVEVLKRARLDTSLTAASAKELRDPTEWLTLGELLDLVTSKKYDNLGLDPILWRRFSEQLVPIRNRLSHMRFAKSGDQERVSMWVGILRQNLDR